jgi:hypothetical protein
LIGTNQTNLGGVLGAADVCDVLEDVSVAGLEAINLTLIENDDSWRGAEGPRYRIEFGHPHAAAEKV